MAKPFPDVKRGKRIIEYRKMGLKWAEIGRLVGMRRDNVKRCMNRVLHLSTEVKKANGIKG